MKAFAVTLAILIIAFFAIKTTQTPSVASVRNAPHEDMTQFSNDLAKFMNANIVKEGAPADMIDISATCKPNQGDYGTRCWVTIESPMAKPEKATAENVRRVGDKFVWDHEA